MVVFDKFVKPSNKIIDFNTQFSGLTEENFKNVNENLVDIQQELLKIITAESILIGHSLDSDFKAMKLFHTNVIDTAHLYPHKRGLPYKRSLKNLAAIFLKKIIQDSESGHDSLEDARAALDLVKLKLQDEINKHIF
ncbi:hypothetical protein SSS_07217 [Sarcoptes scabiei]|nr:hypothetical protein SSS_07217 [Sarcoptes scabiei]